MSKFGLILDFERFQFQNEATYLTPNTNQESIDEVVCRPKIWFSFVPPFMRNWNYNVAPENLLS